MNANETNFRRVEPVIYEAGYNKIVQKDLVSELYKNRTIWITGPITSDYANSIIMQLLCLAKQNNDTITLLINCPGGEVMAGMAIYDVMMSLQQKKIPVATIAVGLAASMGAILLTAGQSGMRKALKHSEVMIHEPLLSGGVGGSTTQIRNLSESLIKTRNHMNEILAKHTGKTMEEIEKATSFDNYMSSEEAQEFGLIDVITDSIF